MKVRGLLISVMAVVSGRRDEEGTSAAYLDEEGSEHRPVEFAQSGSSLHQVPLVQSSPLGTWELQSNLFHAPMVVTCSNS